MYPTFKLNRFNIIIVLAASLWSTAYSQRCHATGLDELLNHKITAKLQAAVSHFEQSSMISNNNTLCNTGDQKNDEKAESSNGQVDNSQNLKQLWTLLVEYDQHVRELVARKDSVESNLTSVESIIHLYHRALEVLRSKSRMNDFTEIARYALMFNSYSHLFRLQADLQSDPSAQVASIVDAMQFKTTELGLIEQLFVELARTSNPPLIELQNLIDKAILGFRVWEKLRNYLTVSLAQEEPFPQLRAYVNRFLPENSPRLTSLRGSSNVQLKRAFGSFFQSLATPSVQSLSVDIPSGRTLTIRPPLRMEGVRTAPAEEKMDTSSDTQESALSLAITLTAPPQQMGSAPAILPSATTGVYRFRAPRSSDFLDVPGRVKRNLRGEWD